MCNLDGLSVSFRTHGTAAACCKHLDLVWLCAGIVLLLAQSRDSIKVLGVLTVVCLQQLYIYISSCLQTSRQFVSVHVQVWCLKAKQSLPFMPAPVADNAEKSSLQAVPKHKRAAVASTMVRASVASCCPCQLAAQVAAAW